LILINFFKVNFFAKMVIFVNLQPALPLNSNSFTSYAVIRILDRVTGSPTIQSTLTGSAVKGTVSRDFLTLFFFHQTTSPGPVKHGKTGLQIFFEFSRSYSSL
jgi:hypothetical protein